MEREPKAKGLPSPIYPTDPAVLQPLAFRDELTALPNRHAQKYHFDELAKQGREIGVILLDLSSFKQVNEMWGYQQGDKKLKETAQFLQEEVRQADQLLAGRLGGDEFIFIIDLSHKQEPREDQEQQQDDDSPQENLEMIVDRIKAGFQSYAPVVEYNEWADKRGLQKLAFHSGYAVRQEGQTLEGVKSFAEIVKHKLIDTEEERQELTAQNDHSHIRKLAIAGLERALSALRK